MELLLGIIFLACFIIGWKSMKNVDPRDTASGRWGIKAGKVARGEFGGKKWGEKE